VTTPHDIDISFDATITTEENSGWTCMVMPGSGDLVHTRRPVKVTGTIDGHPLQATPLPIGDGTHMLPLKAPLRTLLRKDIGDQARVHLERRTS
jgi:Domain of unknown function (DUF1905)